MTNNDLLLQTQANLGGFDVVKAGLTQSTALGAAMAAQWAVGHGSPDRSFIIKEGQSFTSRMTHAQRHLKYNEWKKALKRSLGWSVTNKS